MIVSQLLATCMKSRCCPDTWLDDVTDFNPADAVCVKSTDEYGEEEVPDTDHPLTQGGGGGGPNSLD